MTKAVSYSRLRNTLACETYGILNPFSENPASINGIIAHAAMADYHLGLTKTPGEVYLDAVAAHNAKPDQPHPIDNDLQNESLEGIYWVLDNYDVDPMGIVTVESADGTERLYGKTFARVPVMPGWDLRGGMDLVHLGYLEDGRCIIWVRDYKFGMKIQDDDLQELCYAHMARILYALGMTPENVVIKTEWVYARLKYVKRQTMHLDDLQGKHLDRLKRYVTAYKVAQWNSENGVALAETPGSHCGYCPKSEAGTCPSFKRAEESVTAEKWSAGALTLRQMIQAHEVAKMAAKRAESRGAQLKEKIMAHLDEAGGEDRAGDGAMVVMKPGKKTREYDRGGVIGAAQEMGIQPGDVVEFKKTAWDQRVKDTRPHKAEKPGDQDPRTKENTAHNAKAKELLERCITDVVEGAPGYKITEVGA